MTPFQSFRLWARRAPLSERVLSALACGTVLAAMIWFLVPATISNRPAGSEAQVGASGSSGTTLTPVSGLSSPTTALSASAAGVSGANGTGAGSVSGAGASGSTGAKAGSTASNCPAGTDQGATTSKVTVAILEISAGGAAGNTAYGFPTPAQQQSLAQAVVDSINAAGGAGCRQIVPEYYQGNPLDQNSLQQLCLTIQSAHVFAVFDLAVYLLYPQYATCFPESHVPYFTIYGFTQSLINQYYPYVYSGFTLESNERDTVLGSQAYGYFSADKGFKKLGFFYSDCIPSLATYETNLLNQILPSSSIVTYDVGCPNPFSSPSVLEQAILKFQQAGVTTVTYAQDENDFDNFTTQAQQQNFHPQYLIPDYLMEAIPTGPTHPDYTNIANAFAITPQQDGAQNTSGLAPTTGTVKCNAIMSAHGQPSVYQDETLGGVACDELWEFTAGANHAPAMSRAALVNGLRAAGSVDYSFPAGPNNFADGSITGGEYWRPIQFSEGCTCWTVVGQFKPNL